MKHSKPSRLLSFVLALAMVFSMLPVTVFAAEETAYTQITTADDLTTGKYVMVADNGYAPTVLDGSWVLAEAVTAADGTVTDPAANLVWTITVEGDTVKLTDSNGVTIAPKGGNNNGIASGNYSWKVTCENGLFQFWGQGSDTVVLASNVSYDNQFRGYKTTTVSGNPNGYPSYFTLYKLEGDTTEPTDPDPIDPVEPAGPIADGDRVVIYAPAYGKALSVTKTSYYNVGVDVTVTDGVMTGYSETEVFTVIDNGDGSFSFAYEGQNLGLADSNNSMDLGAVNDDWTLTDLGDGLYNVRNAGRSNYMEWYVQYSNWSTYGSSSAATDDQFQLSFYIVTGDIPTDPDPIDPVDPEPVDPVDPVIPEGIKATLVTDLAELALGDEIILVAPNNNVAMGVNNGNYFNPADVTMGDGVVYFGDDVQTLILESGLTEGTYALNASGYYPCAVSGSSNYLKQEATVTAFSSWTIEIAADGIATIKSTGNAERNWIRYNSTSPRFSCYKSGQNDIAIYKVQRDQYAKLTDELADGTEFVIYYPNGGTVISTTASGNKLTGVAAAPENDFLLVEEDMAVLTASVDENGHYTLTNAEGQYLTCGSTGNSLTFEDAPSDYSLWLPEQTEGGWLIRSVNATYGGYSQYIEVYSDLFTTFSLKETSNPVFYTMQFYALTDSRPSVGGKPADGAQVVIYNLSAQGVLAAENDTQSIENTLATVENGVATPANGGVVFTVKQNGSYYRFYNETYGYLCSNGTGNNAFYAQEASEDADWTLTEGKSGGWNLESRTAKYNGTYSQYLEYYADSYKTYSMYNVTDYDIYEFMFYPVAEDLNLTGGIVNVPTVVFGTLPAAYVGADYTFSVTVDAVFGVDGELTVKAGETALTANEDGTYTIPAELIVGESLTITVSGVDTKGIAISGEAVISVKDEPTIGEVAPAANAQTLDDKRPTISAVIVNAGEDATVEMTVNDEAVDAVYENGVISWTSDEDMADGRTSVNVTVTRADGKTASKVWSFTVGEAKYELYFGQLHSHTTYSDGSGSLESALDYIASLPESANVDFVAFTDHSNYFDSTTSANPEQAIYDMSLASASSQSLWTAYKKAADEFNANHSDVVAIAGFEMTWSGGPGHINTFATPGIVSRNNTTLNNKTSDAGMKAYYALLSQSEGIESVSQFNHPGTTFGNFSDFAYWDALIDSRMYLVEVGNGEGAVGAGGYFPSYEQYTMALDKGWHVAPTNNQDNHKGKWGNANDARDVVLTDNFTEEGIYEAIRNYRVYATEDKNLEIGYTVNGQMLGSTIAEVPEELNIAVTVYDPDASDSITKVEVIVNSGKVAYTWDDPADLADGALKCALNPAYSYYYIRVTEGDGDLAVTAPVWVGETLKLGISAVETTTATPVTGEELTINTTLFNSETKDATVKSLTYTVGSQVLGVDTTGYTIPASDNTTVSFAYTPDTAKVMSITVTAVVELDGVEYTFTMDITLDVQDAEKLVYIGIDASHYNEYVNGNYKDSMGNFSNLAAEYSVRTVTLNTSEELIAACENDKYVALILTAPSRRDGIVLRDPYATYSNEEIAALVEFNANGGALILTGWGDYYESYASFPDEDHMAAQQNKLLEAIGSSIRISDDETKDDTHNGGQSQRLYLSVYDFDNFLLDGVEYDAENPYDNMYTELYSQYGGASIYVVDGNGDPTADVPSTVTPAVYGFDTTYSSDDDKDSFGGLGATQKYAVGDTENLMVLATEELRGQGLIVVAGAAFLSNFEVQATIEDSGAEKNYSNYKICENLLAYLNPAEITDIAEVRAQTDTGVKYTIEGVVTSNASGFDKSTAFFDCIYVQDFTGGICCFPVAGNYKIGDLVRITGTTDFYQGEPELQVTSIEVIGEGVAESTAVTAAQVNDRSVEGQLITVNGTVESFELANGLVQTIMVKDENGDVVRVFIDGYITTDEDVKDLAVGCNISVTGLASYDDTFNAPEGPFPRIRVRDRADVVCTAAHVHNYKGTVTIEAGCETDGLMTYTCSCGDSYTEKIPATGHDVVLKEYKAATCEQNGFEYYACAKCGGQEYQIILEATGHNYEDGVCTNCGAADPNASKPGIGGILDKLKEWIGGWFKPAPEEPTEPSVPDPTEPEEPTEPVKPSKPGWGDWFKWFWPFG